MIEFIESIPTEGFTSINVTLHTRFVSSEEALQNAKAHLTESTVNTIITNRSIRRENRKESNINPQMPISIVLRAESTNDGLFFVVARIAQPIVKDEEYTPTLKRSGKR